MKTSTNAIGLSDTKLDIKIKLSALWISLMFLFVYADLKAMYQTGSIEAIIKGEIIGMKINDMFLLCSAILMSIPAIMIFLSIFLKPKLNRIFNVIFPLLFVIVNTGTYFAPGKVWWYYIYFTSLEYLICILIILITLKWPKTEIKQQQGIA